MPWEVCSSMRPTRAPERPLYSSLALKMQVRPPNVTLHLTEPQQLLCCDIRRKLPTSCLGDGEVGWYYSYGVYFLYNVGYSKFAADRNVTTTDH